jgi:transketolase
MMKLIMYVNASEVFIMTKVLAHNIRRHAINMTSSGGSSHIGSILSIADILAVLYGYFQ